jgi:hypothetical protein
MPFTIPTYKVYVKVKLIGNIDANNVKQYLRNYMYTNNGAWTSRSETNCWSYVFTESNWWLMNCIGGYYEPLFEHCAI